MHLYRTSLSAVLTMSLMLCTAASLANAGSPAAQGSTSSAAAVDALKAKTRSQLVDVPAGSFLMGDFGPIHSEERLPYTAERDDDVLRQIELDGFRMQALKVTYEDFDTYSDAVAKPRVAQSEVDQNYRNLPDIAAGVSWTQAAAYCGWLGEQIGIPMMLPTEAQWEYAARAGGRMWIYATDNGEMENGRNVSNMDQYQAFARKHGQSTFVSSLGAFPPNPLGLYDMVDHGREWVSDWYFPEYDVRQTRNPTGPASGTERVQRSSSDRDAGQLSITSMTFTRSHEVPEPGPASYADGTVLESNPNPNFGNGFRCAAKAR